MFSQGSFGDTATLRVRGCRSVNSQSSEGPLAYTRGFKAIYTSMNEPGYVDGLAPKGRPFSENQTCRGCPPDTSMLVPGESNKHPPLVSIILKSLRSDLLGELGGKGRWIMMDLISESGNPKTLLGQIGGFSHHRRVHSFVSKAWPLSLVWPVHIIIPPNLGPFR